MLGDFYFSNQKIKTIKQIDGPRELTVWFHYEMLWFLTKLAMNDK